MNYVLICTSQTNKTLSQAVQDAGFEPMSGQSVHDIVGLVVDYYPIAIIVDLTEDLEVGLVNLDALQNYPTTAYQPRLAYVTADETSIQRAIEQGATEIITAPLHFLELRTRLRTMMALKERGQNQSDDASITEKRLMGVVPLMEHDLRSPSAIALSSLDLLNEILSDEPDLPAEIFELLNNSLNALRRQLFLVQDFVDWIRLEAHQFDLAHGSVNITKAIEDGIQYGAALAETNGIGIALKIDKNLPSPGGDSILFQRVINAAVDCAIKFCMRGQTITISAQSENDGVTVTLSDDGKPIMDQYRNNLLFALERQGEARHIGSRSTVALGLPFCHAAIIAMNGTIDFISDDEANLTHLRMWLPI